MPGFNLSARPVSNTNFIYLIDCNSKCSIYCLNIELLEEYSEKMFCGIESIPVYYTVVVVDTVQRLATTVEFLLSWDPHRQCDCVFVYGTSFVGNQVYQVTRLILHDLDFMVIKETRNESRFVNVFKRIQIHFTQKNLNNRIISF